ncbi:MAG: DDE-type integrase/transposase/recombinase [Proteobacteria bacterium]|nr:DDE-type integrase/transposase/recombinase [Pseudomonadota bacterium]
MHAHLMALARGTEDHFRRQKAQARHLRKDDRSTTARQKKHLIYFPVKFGGVRFRRAFLDTGCDRSVISRLAFDYLKSKMKKPPEERKIPPVTLSAWFGNTSTTDTEVGAVLHIGRHNKPAFFLIVDCADYEIVIGNDIFRGLFQAGIKPGLENLIIFPDGSTLKYECVANSLPPTATPDLDNNARLPVHVARKQKIAPRSIARVEVYIPPFKHTDGKDINWSMGLMEPTGLFCNNRKLNMKAQLLPPLALSHVVVANASSVPIVVKEGDRCAWYTPVVEAMEKAETARWAAYIPYLVAVDDAEILIPKDGGYVRAQPGKIFKPSAAGTTTPLATPAIAAPAAPAAPSPASMVPAATAAATPTSADSPTATASATLRALATSTPSSTAPTAPPPQPDRVISDVKGKVDPGADGVSFDERVEIPNSANQPPVATALGDDCPQQLRQQYEQAIGSRILVNDHAFAPELSKAQPMRIRLVDNRIVNITRHLPIDKAKAADEIALEYARQHIIRESVSPFNAPVVLAKKPDGSWRFCVDYRALNAVTERDAYEFPLINDMLNALAGNKVFSTIDLSAGFHQLPIEEESRKYTAFSTLSGHWEFNRVPYGLTNSPPWMQRAISQALRGLEWNICVVWIDDIIIFSKSHEEHLEHLGKVLDALRNAGFQVRLRKCKFAVSKVKYLGHMVSAEGIAPLEENLKDIREAKPPTTVKELQRVLGLFNYYRRFVHGFGRLTRPLNQYLLGNPPGKQPISLAADAREAFEELKIKLITAPVLAYPDFSKPFIIETDASQHHVAGILSQIGPDEKEHPVAYWSDALTERQAHWSAYKRELFALIGACKHWRNYLQIKQEFTARFDQRALKWIFEVRDREPMLAGWIMQLEEYGIRLEYQPGEKNQHVDALTKGPINRNPYLHGGESYAPGALSRPKKDIVKIGALRTQEQPVRNDLKAELRPRVPEIYLNALNFRPLVVNLANFAKDQREDPELEPIFKDIEGNVKPDLEEKDMKRWLTVRKDYVIDPESRILYQVIRRRGEVARRRRVVPRKLREAVMNEYHGETHAGHFHFDKAYPRLADDFFWPGMAADFYKHCRLCKQCGAFNGKPNSWDTRGLAGKLVNFPELTRPCERVAMDIHGPYPTVRGYKHLLVMTDHFTRFVWLAPLKGQTHYDIADAYLRTFLQHGILPSQILTDRGGGFDKLMARAIAEAWGIRKKATTAYHPQCNGMPERFNQTIAATFSKILEGHQENWLDYVPSVAYAYNIAHHPSIKMAPVTAMFGITPVSPIAATLGREHNDPAHPTPLAAEEVRRQRMEEVWQIVRTLDRKAKERQKYYFDRSHDTKTKYEVGERVWLFTPHLGVDRKLKGQKKSLLSLWAGPYVVVEVDKNGVNYKLKNARGRPTVQWVHIQRLKPYTQRPMPVGVPATFVFADDFVPEKETDFDFESNSDRWEPNPSEGDLEWTVEDFEPRTSVEMVTPPLPDDLFRSRPNPLLPTIPNPKPPAKPSGEARPASPPARAKPKPKAAAPGPQPSPAKAKAKVAAATPPAPAVPEAKAASPPPAPRLAPSPARPVTSLLMPNSTPAPVPATKPAAPRAPQDEAAPLAQAPSTSAPPSSASPAPQAEAPRAEAAASWSASDIANLPSPIPELYRDLRTHREALDHIGNTEGKEEQRIWKAKITHINEALQSHLAPDNYKRLRLEKKMPASPLIHLKLVLDYMLSNFREVFQDTIDPLVTGIRPTRNAKTRTTRPLGAIKP